MILPKGATDERMCWPKGVLDTGASTTSARLDGCRPYRGLAFRAGACGRRICDALLGLVRSMDAIAVDGSRPRIRQVAVPDLVGVFGQGYPLDLTIAPGVEQAELDLGRVRGKQGEVDAEPVPCRAERVG